MIGIRKLSERIDKKKLHHIWKKLSFIKVWQLIALLIIFTAIAVWSLRQNSLKTIELQDKVLVSDNSGNGTEQAIKSLGDHIISHMNSDMAGPIELPATFNRDYEKLVLTSESLTNSEYLSIRDKCVTFDVPVEVQSECIRNETSQITNEEFSLPTELYSFDFKTPFWSPDMAGWSSLLAVLTSLLLAAKLATDYIVKQILRASR